MDPLIVMPDLEQWATGWCRDFLAGMPFDYASGVYVDHVTPNPRQQRMAIFRKDGGTQIDMLHEQASLSVNVYAEDEATVDDLARLIHGGLLSVRAQAPIEYVISQSSPVGVDDASPRRYFVVEPTVRGTDMSYSLSL